MSLKIYRRGEIWHYRGTVAGQRLRGSTETPEKSRAKRIASEVETNYWKRHLDGPSAHLTFANAANLYRDAEKSTRFLDRIEDFWQNEPISKITPGAIRQSAIKLYPNAGPATRNRHVIVPTQAIINHSASMELCNRISVKRFPVVTKIKEPATLDWVKSFAKHASPHLGALCYFMFGTGARISEAIDLRWGDVNLNNGTALIRQTKIGAERTSHLPQPIVIALANIPCSRRNNDKVFRYSARDTAREPWNAVIKRAKIKHLSFHSCRHGFATTLLHNNIDIVTIAKIGGWKDASQIIKTYGHAMTDPTLNDVIFDTELTHKKANYPVSYSKQRDKI
ncbi:MAG: site-specific integrase [Blastopirellula sp.]|nr:MAG: site-specific integrase [Blastopirellula sp.]